MNIQHYDKHNPQYSFVIDQVAMLESRLHDQQGWDQTAICLLLSSDYVHLLLVFDEQTVVGYCLYQSLFEQAEIFRIGTHPSFHRQGIAQYLLNHLFSIFTDTHNLLLEVRADNNPAIRLYQKLDFVTIDCRKDYYKSANNPTVDGLIMQKMFVK